MRFLAPSTDDIRTWGCCFKLYSGATATGSSESNLEPLTDGGLSATIPLEGTDQVKQLFLMARLDQVNPQGDWCKIDECHTLKLSLTGYKFETSFRGTVKWFINCNVQFIKEDGVLRVISAEPYVGSAITSDIEEVGLLVDKVMAYRGTFVHAEQGLAY